MIGSKFSPRRTYPFSVFFQAEDGIRDHGVTVVQTCALPIDASYDYGSDGYLSHVIISNGLLFSCVDTNGTGAKDSDKTDLIVNFMDLFDAFNAIHPIGMGIEWDDDTH